MNKTELAIIRQKYRPDGGAEKIIQRMLQELSNQHAIHVNMITQQWDGNANDVNILSIKKKGIFRYSRFEYFIRDVQDILKKYNFDLTQSHERVPGVQIYRAGDGVHQHWLSIRKEKAFYLQKIIWKYSPFHRKIINAERALFYHQNLKAVICNSNQVKNEIAQYYPKVDKNKLVLIRNGIDLNTFAYADKATKSEARKALGLADNDKIIVFVGSGFYRKGLTLLLDALVLRKKWKLLVVGNDKKIAQYQGYCSGLNIKDRVIFAGVQKQVIPYYQAADLLIHPALYDPAPNVVLEAMAIGRAVICSQNSGTSELIDNNGYVCSHKDSEQLASLIKKCENQALLEKMGKQSRRIAEKYPISRMVKEMVELYSKQLKAHS